MRSGFLSVLAIVLFLPVAASAQSLGNLAGETSSQFTVSVSPQYPTPGSQASLSFLSSSLDLTNSTLKVSVGNKNIYTGSVQPVAVPLGSAGSITTVAITLSTGGTEYTQILKIQPQDVVLIAEPISSTHVLYPGKPLVPLEGDVRIVAVANLRGATGKMVNPSLLSYSWTVDDTRIANSSGIGKSAIIVASPLQYRARDVSVSIMNLDGSLVGGAVLTLAPQEPSVRIYANDPLLGIRFDHALSGSYTIQGSEATLFAVPFSLPTTGGSPLLQWFLNGVTAQTGSSITLRPTGDGQGSASLSLTASTGTNTPATTNLSLIFGATKSTNFFGL